MFCSNGKHSLLEERFCSQTNKNTFIQKQIITNRFKMYINFLFLYNMTYILYLNCKQLNSKIILIQPDERLILSNLKLKEII